ncbi:DNA repair protein RadA [Chitinophagales bacterium]|jgi:DNA repair protein RadA/Sms|nr:DNA repair protein RadA [Chitinophagales bacterium]|tara:strand:+ start:4078 stop:5451 length:1374 start_codon:yes stop_codon:yes gene_type:complete
MAKIKTTFACQQCGSTYAKWQGKCNTCLEWNTIVEEVIEKPVKGEIDWRKTEKQGQAKPTRLKDVQVGETYRMDTGDSELNRVLGGGITPGSLVLMGGEPGIGKSTLLLQVAIQLKERKILYISGEESEKQIQQRALRLGNTNDDCYILTETATHKIFHFIRDLQPDIVIVDSIQTVHSKTIESTPGSVSQIRECTAEFQRFAKETNTPVFLVGHITKDGQIAGPKILEHIVDTVLQFEGDRNHVYRILRTIKNRFGSTAELGLYEMQGHGLRIVENPSEILITQKDDNLGGVAIAATMEGLRPMLIEVQALVSTAFYGTPQRSATGFDTRRLNMLLAVLEKRVGLNIGTKDVFLNIAGGLKVEDPAIDLSIAAALMSAYNDVAIDMKFAFAGEVGLSGEVRAVNRVDQRIQEAEKLGFDKIFVSKYNFSKGKKMPQQKIEIVLISKVYELLKQLNL